MKIEIKHESDSKVQLFEKQKLEMKLETKHEN